jgi:hypothetical protein
MNFGYSEMSSRGGSNEKLAKLPDLKYHQSPYSRPLLAGMPPRPKTKSRPRKIPYSQEDLKDRTQDLNAQISALKKENQHLTRQLQQMERITLKRKPSVEGSLPVNRLRQKCRDLQKSVDEKDCQLQELKLKSKSTKIPEFQTDIELYKNQAKSLRDMLEESLYQITLGYSPHDLEERYHKQTQQLKNLQRDVYEIRARYEDAAGLQDKKAENRLLEMRKSLIEEKENNMRTMAEHQRLGLEMQKLQQALICPNCGAVPKSKTAEEVWGEIWFGLECENIILDDLLLSESSSHELVEREEFQKLLKQIYAICSDEDLGCIQVIFPISKDELLNAMITHKPEFPSYLEMQDALNHLSLKFQLLGCYPDQLQQTLFPSPSPYLREEFQYQLMTTPIELSPEIAESLALFIYACSRSLSGKDVTRRLLHSLGTWEIISENREESIHENLNTNLGTVASRVLSMCLALDEESTGYLKLEDWNEVLRKCSVNLAEEIVRYLRLCFYAETGSLEGVPYRHFLSQWVECEEESA